MMQRRLTLLLTLLSLSLLSTSCSAAEYSIAFSFALAPGHDDCPADVNDGLAGVRRETLRVHGGVMDGEWQSGGPEFWEYAPLAEGGCDKNAFCYVMCMYGLLKQCECCPCCSGFFTPGGGTGDDDTVGSSDEVDGDERNLRSRRVLIDESNLEAFSQQLEEYAEGLLDGWSYIPPCLQYPYEVIVNMEVTGTPSPTSSPTEAPTKAPTDAPTDAPTKASTEAPTDAPTSEPTPTPTGVITKIVVVNTETGDDVMDLDDGVTLPAGIALNLRADYDNGEFIQSVQFKLDGSWARTESAAPYTIGGDSDGVYFAWSPSSGSHTVEAIPYTEPSAYGAAGQSLLISFTVP